MTIDPHFELVQALSLAERAVLQRLTEAVTRQGSTVEQWRILTLLADGKGHPMGELAAFAFVPAPTLTRIVDKMVADNLVYRRIDTADRRRVMILIAARGKKLLTRLQRELQKHAAAIEGGHDGVDLSTLTTALGRLADRAGSAAAL